MFHFLAGGELCRGELLFSVPPEVESEDEEWISNKIYVDDPNIFVPDNMVTFNPHEPRGLRPVYIYIYICIYTYVYMCKAR